MENEKRLPEMIVNKKTFKDYIKLRKKDAPQKKIKGMEQYLQQSGFADPSAWKYEVLDDIHDLIKDYNKAREKVIKYENKGKKEEKQEAWKKVQVILAQLREFGYKRPIPEQEDLTPFIEDLDAQFLDWNRKEKTKEGKN